MRYEKGHKDATRKRIVDVASTQQPAVNLRVQRLYATIHDFRKPRMRRDLCHRDAVLFQQRGRAAGREDGNTLSMQRLRKLY